MEKPGLEQAVMIWGAGASMIHLIKNLNAAYIKTNRTNTAKDSDFSDRIDSITGWFVKVVMGIILLSNCYHLFFSGAQTGRLLYCFGIGVSLVYFFFFADFSFADIRAVKITGKKQEA